MTPPPSSRTTNNIFGRCSTKGGAIIRIGDRCLGYINAATSRKGYYPMSAFGGKADIAISGRHVRL
jgi:hypothetical protein